MINKIVASTKRHGFVDNIKVFGDFLVITGWATSGSGEIPMGFLVSGNSKNAFFYEFEKISRPDVQRVLGLSSMAFGFRLKIKVDTEIFCRELRVSAKYESDFMLHELAFAPNVLNDAFQMIVEEEKINPGLSPVQAKVIAEHGYEIIKTIKKGKIYIVKKGNSNFILKKHATHQEIDNYASIYQKWASDSNGFHCLYLPKPIECLEEFNIVEYVDGVQLQWSESPLELGYGGSLISTETVSPIIKLAFDLGQLGVNSDFYWRNFIFFDDKIAAIDWELGNFKRASVIALLAYIYVLMFKNKAWQAELIKEINERKLASVDEFRSELIVQYRQFEQQWKEYPAIVNDLRKDFAIASSQIGFNKLWNGYALTDLLENSKYHVFEELGQIYELESQIDCKAKLDKLFLHKINFFEKSILDIGCNSGWFMKEFALLGAKNIIGLEIEESGCCLAKKILNEVFDYSNCSVVCGDIMSFDSDPFDIVTSISMFHYIEDKLSFFFRVGKLTKENGVFLLETPVHESDNDVVVWDMNPKRYIPSVELIEKYAKLAGFELIYFGNSNLSDRRVFHFKKTTSRPVFS